MTTMIQLISRWAIPFFVLSITIVGMERRVPIYESFVEGAKEGWQTAVRLLPYLVGMLVAIQIFQHSGALDILITLIRPLTRLVGFPEEILPLALMRPISGSGSLALLTQALQVFGPDSFLGRLAAALMGSTETSFYVLTVYAGSISLRRTRHTLATSLTADLAGFLAALYVVRYLFP